MGGAMRLPNNDIMVINMSFLWFLTMLVLVATIR